MMLLEFLNIGLSEIIILFFSIIFLVGFIWIIIFIGRTVLKSKANSKANFPVNNYTINVDSSENSSKKNELDSKEKQIMRIALPQQSEIKYVEVAKVIRCEADDNYTKFVLDDGVVLVSRSLKEYASLLKSKGFMRTHQSHLVNQVFVKSWLKEDGGMLLLTNNEKIPVSKPNRDIIKEMLGVISIS